MSMSSLLPFVRVMKYGPVNGIQGKIKAQWTTGSILFNIIGIILDSVRQFNKFLAALELLVKGFVQ